MIKTNLSIRRALTAAALVLVGTPAFANGLNAASGTANCDGWTLQANAFALNPATSYTVDYTVTISGCVASPTDVTGQVPVVKDAVDPTKGVANASGTWPATLNGTCTVSGSATLTGNPNPGGTKTFTTANFQCTPPDNKGICHNIGGPRDLGANCDSNNQCTITLDTGATVTTDGNNFFGIIIHASPKANKAHIKHGDGPLLLTFDPPLHLASEIGPHKASNVECLGERVNPQPPEPGN